MNARFSYKQAVEMYLDAINQTRSMPSQPNKFLSNRSGKSWWLRNTNGLLARIKDSGEVVLGKEVE